MELLVSLLVGKPLNIVAVAAVFLVIGVARRHASGGDGDMSESAPRAIHLEAEDRWRWRR